MKLTVKDLSRIAGVSIKTLHHYHKIGLLIPNEISETGYRYYGLKEINRLQEILFYKELDIPLLDIKNLLGENSNRVITLEKQMILFEKKIWRYQQLIKTITRSIEYTKKGEKMDNTLMFKGFETEEEWKNALEQQNNYLKENYNTEINTTSINISEMNIMAIEAKNFTDRMAEFLRNGVKYNDSSVQHAVNQHLKFLNKNGHPISKEDYVNQTKFFLQDDFHRDMLEQQQIGLTYYLVAVAENLLIN
ncbi:MerR family transcriptional regulator [Cytobacillus massiliigabonensis]|uniref:MerR family transcriptional regulator n=1 Tax=Cytobacillus massiliigabonensis TaxID=1871011 RepID=UPI000C830B5E|nr:MerR family transcriptional regulator [Cytobacillus massiliigabonensis]